MILYIIHKVPLFRKLYFNRIGRPFVQKKIRPVLPHLKVGESILDVGSGNGLVAHLLRQHGHNITPLDIHEGQYHESVKPVVYDGKNFPFADKQFDTGIILTVLHHIENPEQVLQEAGRVCRKLIIMEDIYDTNFQKHLTFFIDKLANLWYSPCPHTNKNDEDWKKTFSSMHMKLMHSHYRHVILVIKQGIYVLECE